MEHIQVHTDEIKGPNVLLWPPDKTQYLQAHIQMHMQMMQRVMMMMAQQKNLQSQQGGGPSGQDNPGAAPNQKGGAAIVGGQPDVSAAPNQATGTPAQQASGATGGGV